MVVFDEEVVARLDWLRGQSVEFRKKWIADRQAKNGGFTRETLESIGISWPPPRGWRKKFTDGGSYLGREAPWRVEKREEQKRRQAEKRKNKKKVKKLRKVARIQKKPEEDFLQSFEWRKLRYATLKKYGSRCMACGRTPRDGVTMNVDHIKCRRDYPELALDPENLQVLCNECNHGKGNWDQTDWRPTPAEQYND